MTPLLTAVLSTAVLFLTLALGYGLGFYTHKWLHGTVLLLGLAGVISFVATWAAGYTAFAVAFTVASPEGGVSSDSILRSMGSSFWFALIGVTVGIIQSKQARPQIAEPSAKARGPFLPSILKFVLGGGVLIAIVLPMMQPKNRDECILANLDEPQTPAAVAAMTRACSRLYPERDNIQRPELAQPLSISTEQGGALDSLEARYGGPAGMQPAIRTDDLQEFLDSKLTWEEFQVSKSSTGGFIGQSGQLISTNRFAIFQEGFFDNMSQDDFVMWANTQESPTRDPDGDKRVKSGQVPVGDYRIYIAATALDWSWDDFEQSDDWDWR